MEKKEKKMAEDLVGTPPEQTAEETAITNITSAIPTSQYEQQRRAASYGPFDRGTVLRNLMANYRGNLANKNYTMPYSPEQARATGGSYFNRYSGGTGIPAAISRYNTTGTVAGRQPLQQTEPQMKYKISEEMLKNNPELASIIDNQDMILKLRDLKPLQPRKFEIDKGNSGYKSRIPEGFNQEVPEAVSGNPYLGPAKRYEQEVYGMMQQYGFYNPETQKIKLPTNEQEISKWNELNNRLQEMPNISSYWAEQLILDKRNQIAEQNKKSEELYDKSTIYGGA